MTYFSSHSPFASEAQLRMAPLENAEVYEAQIKEQQEKIAATHPYEHWHHDLHTVDILLDQQPPDVERARRMVQEIADEMRQEFR